MLCRKAGKYTAFLYLVQKIPAVEGISIAVIKIYTGQRQLYFKLKHLHDYTRKGFDEMSPFKVPKEIPHAIMTENPPKSPCSTATTIKPPSRKCTDQLTKATASSPFTIRKVTENKKQYLSLLLLADEQESMIDRYLDKGTMYVLDDDGIKAECVVTDEGNGILEIKNIATAPESQGKGYAKKLIEYLFAKYKGTYHILQAGTGDSPLTIPFYEKCGFARHHVIKNFFTDNYDQPIFEYGVRLVDMIYLQRKL